MHWLAIVDVRCAMAKHGTKAQGFLAKIRILRDAGIGFGIPQDGTQ